MATFLVVIGIGTFLNALRITRSAGRLILWSAYIVAPALVYLSTFREIAISWAAAGIATFAFSQLLHAIGKNSAIVHTVSGKKHLSIALLAFVGTLLVWPVLLAERVEDLVAPKKHESQPDHLKVSPELLPIEIEGRISFTFHIGSDEGEEMVWLEEYGNQEFYLTSDAFEEAGLEEGAQIRATVASESGERVGVKNDIYWFQSVKRAHI